MKSYRPIKRGYRNVALSNGVIFLCLNLEETMKQVKTYNFIEITKKEFQQYQVTPITNAQAVEIQNNLFGVVDLLLQWSSKTDSNIKCA